MANTTFTGAVRSQNGFEVVSKNTTTGAFTTSFTLDASGLQVAPVSVSDGNVTIAAATNAGRVNLVLHRAKTTHTHYLLQKQVLRIVLYLQEQLQHLPMRSLTLDQTLTFTLVA